MWRGSLSSIFWSAIGRLLVVETANTDAECACDQSAVGMPQDWRMSPAVVVVNRRFGDSGALYDLRHAEVLLAHESDQIRVERIGHNSDYRDRHKWATVGAIVPFVTVRLSRTSSDFRRLSRTSSDLAFIQAKDEKFAICRKNGRRPGEETVPGIRVANSASSSSESRLGLPEPKGRCDFQPLGNRLVAIPGLFSRP